MTHEEASTILVVEDDDATRSFLAENLAADGYAPILAESVQDGLRLAEQAFPDLALVDVNLPDGVGLDLLRQVRAADGVTSRIDPALPVMLVTGRAGELDRVRGLSAGADDYVTKPFHYPELRERVAAVLRRTQRRPGSGRLRVGELSVDPTSREVHLAGERLDLSQKEYLLLKTLAGEPTRVHTKSELLRGVWGYRDLGSARTLDSHACRLRRKLGREHGRWVVNVWGVGYRLVDGD